MQVRREEVDRALLLYMFVCAQHLTQWCDGEYSVRGRGPVDIRRVSHGARVGPVIAQRGIDQRDGGIPTRWASLPPDTISKLTAG